MALKSSGSGKNLLPVSDSPRDEEEERLVKGDEKLFKGSVMTKRGAYAAVSYMLCAGKNLGLRRASRNLHSERFPFIFCLIALNICFAFRFSIENLVIGETLCFICDIICLLIESVLSLR